MKFPKGTTKRQKRLAKELYIENLTTSITDHEKRIVGMERTIKDTRKAISETKKHILHYRDLIKDAENTKVD